MQVATRLNPDYAWRILLFGLVFTGWGLWTLYAGLVAFPNFNEQHGYSSKWGNCAQLVMAAVCLPLGLAALGSLIRNAFRRFSADEYGLHGLANGPIPYEAIQSIDWSRWNRKGIAVVKAEVAGRTRAFKLDDWKLKGVNDILKAVEERRPGLTRPSEEPVRK